MNLSVDWDNTRTPESYDYDVDGVFLWRTRAGEDLRVNEMETRHLFYTLKMIWNHSAPEEFKIKPYKKYIFSDFYTNEYILKAVKAMIYELRKREDIELYLHDLNLMIEVFKHSLEK